MAAMTDHCQILYLQADVLADLSVWIGSLFVEHRLAFVWTLTSKISTLTPLYWTNKFSYPISRWRSFVFFFKFEICSTMVAPSRRRLREFVPLTGVCVFMTSSVLCPLRKKTSERLIIEGFDNVLPSCDWQEEECLLISLMMKACSSIFCLSSTTHHLLLSCSQLPAT